MSKRLVVSEETGEITNTLEDGDRIVKKKSVEALQDQLKMEYKDFAVLNTEELNLLMQELSMYEMVALFRLLPYVKYSSCLLAYKNGRGIGTEDIPKLVGISRNKTYEVVEDLIKRDILYKGKNSREVQYFINPWIIYRGKFVNKVLQDMFQNYRIRSKGGTKWKNLEKN